MDRKLALLIFVVFSLFLSGCAHKQPPITLAQNYLQDQTPSIGVVVGTIPQANTVETGQVGLLDLAIISAANSSLIEYLKALNLNEFSEIQQKMVGGLEEKGFKVVAIEAPLNIAALPNNSKKVGFSTKDFSSLKEQYNVDHLLLLQLHSAGTTRSYYGPIPTSNPAAFVNATGQLIDLTSHQLLWHLQTNESIALNGAWDEPDLSFPLITNSVYQVLEQSKNRLHTNFYR